MRWLVLVLAACAPDIGPLPGDTGAAGDTGDTGDTDVPKPLITHVDEGGGVTLTQVKATSATEWRGIDLDAPPADAPLDPTVDVAWDLAWQRFAPMVNGGVSGEGGVEVQIVPDVDLADVTGPPLDGEWLTDQPDADGDGDPELAMWGWFDYAEGTHVLTAKRQVYVVHTTEGAFVGVQIVAYYNQAGSSGYPSFRWKKLP